MKMCWGSFPEKRWGGIRKHWFSVKLNAFWQSRDYSTSGNKVFSINQNNSPDSQKTIFDSTIVFLIQNVFFDSKCFFRIQLKIGPAGLTKKQFRSEKTISVQKWTISGYFGPFWAHFGSIRVKNVFFGSKCFFAKSLFTVQLGPAGLTKKHFEWKKQF